MNFEPHEGLIAAFMTVVAGVAAWVRGERIRNTKAKKVISGDETETLISDGHREEFKRLQEAVAKLMPLSQEVEMLKAKLAGIWVYCEMLLLCETCSHNNEKIIKKMQEALDTVVKPVEGDKLQPSQAQKVKDFLKENYG